MLSSRHHIHEWTMSSTRRLRTQVQASQDCEIILGWAFLLLQSEAATPYLVHHHIHCWIFVSIRAILYTFLVNLRWAFKFELFPFHPIIWNWLLALSNKAHKLKSSNSMKKLLKFLIWGSRFMRVLMNSNKSDIPNLIGVTWPSIVNTIHFIIYPIDEIFYADTLTTIFTNYSDLTSTCLDLFQSLQVLKVETNFSFSKRPLLAVTSRALRILMRWPALRGNQTIGQL